MQSLMDYINSAYVNLTVREDEEGQGLVEYALIIALVAIVVIAALILLAPAIGNILNRVSNSLNAA